MAFFCQKWKSKQLPSLSQFSLVTGFFEGTRENILHIFRALLMPPFQKISKLTLNLVTFKVEIILEQR